MKLRTLIFFGVGYALGARSQAEDTEDLQSIVKSVTSSDAFQMLLDQGKKLAATGVEAVTGQTPSWGESSEGEELEEQTGADEEEASEESSEDDSGSGKSAPAKRSASKRSGSKSSGSKGSGSAKKSSRSSSRSKSSS